MKRTLSLLIVIALLVVFITCFADNIYADDTYTAIQRGESGQHVVELQTRLVELGYNTNGIDGNFGGGTESAIIAFQTNNSLPATGIADAQTLELLFGKISKFGQVTDLNHLMAYAVDDQDYYTICILDSENNLVKLFATNGSQVINGEYTVQDDYHYTLNFETANGNTAEKIEWDSDGSKYDFKTSDGTTFTRIYLDEAASELSKRERITNPAVVELTKPYTVEGKNYTHLKNISSSSGQSYSSSSSTQTLVPTDTSPVQSQTAPQRSNALQYVLNTNTHKFHYPNCKSVKQMKSSNRWDYTGTRDEIISMGYVPCKNCNP